MSEARPSLPGAWTELRAAARSPRLISVALLSFSSGLPLGLVWMAIPAWLARAGVDVRWIGLFTLVQAPWSFKVLWSPAMDRYAPPLLGRKRGFVLLAQLALCVLSLGLAGVSDRPEALCVVAAFALAIALASATQDIAVDAYAVEVLRREEQGIGSGARTAFYRAGMLVSGGLSITIAAETSWAFVNAMLALFYLPLLVLTWRAPEPEASPPGPRSLRAAVWDPLVGLLGQDRAVEILSFVVLFKLSDNLSQSLARPFLVQVGFDDFDVGIATSTIGQLAAAAGALIGGLVTGRVGLGRALWVFGALQILSNLGYAAVAQVGVDRPLMYAAQAFELGTSGLGMGAFGVLLLRLTDRRFSATQYALLSTLFALPRVLAGPVAGLLVHALGWRDFFIATVLFGLPGMLMLGRFVPWSAREIEFQAPSAATSGAPLSRPGLVWRSALGGLITGAVGAGLLVVLIGSDSGSADLLAPRSVRGALAAAGVTALAGLGALATAAALFARRGLRGPTVPSPGRALRE